MKSPAIVSLALVGLSAAALAGCTSGGTVAREADTSVKDASVTDAPADSYSGICTFSADAFDQSCTTDMDCVAVTAGYYCAPGCGCDPIGISKNALGDFNAAVAQTRVGSGAVEGADCSCPLELGPCCIGGTCQANEGCFSLPADTLPACADAGGTCSRFVGGCGSLGQGPPDSCAYPDETCCRH
jgi:hypothetical protein